MIKIISSVTSIIIACIAVVPSAVYHQYPMDAYLSSCVPFQFFLVKKIVAKGRIRKSREKTIFSAENPKNAHFVIILGEKCCDAEKFRNSGRYNPIHFLILCNKNRRTNQPQQNYLLDGLQKI
jgi:hypothetical protein